MVATGCRDRIIRLWNAETGAELGTLRGHGIWVTARFFSPDGKKLVSGAGAHPLVPGRRSEVRLWDLVSRKEIRTLLNSGGGGVASVTFAPDGKRVAAARPVEEQISGRSTRASESARSHLLPIKGQSTASGFHPIVGILPPAASLVE